MKRLVLSLVVLVAVFGLGIWVGRENHKREVTSEIAKVNASGVVAKSDEIVQVVASEARAAFEKGGARAVAKLCNGDIQHDRELPYLCHAMSYWSGDPATHTGRIGYQVLVGTFREIAFHERSNGGFYEWGCGDPLHWETHDIGERNGSDIDWDNERVVFKW